MLVHTVTLIITCFYLIGSLSSWLALTEWRWSAKMSDSRKQSERAVGETVALKEAIFSPNTAVFVSQQLFAMPLIYPYC